MRKSGKPKKKTSVGCFEYDLGAAMKPQRIAPTWVHLGVAGAGVVLGLVSYPYNQTPIGMTLMGAAGSVAAVGMLLLVYDLLKNKNILDSAT